MDNKPQIRPEWVPSAYKEGIGNAIEEKGILKTGVVKPVVKREVKPKRRQR
ncbi:hypothetical protein [Mucilaginibacter sp. FT3.2]|uniref:hypothetical protein n=1 Tax=Mucilaginibacter sp. FT3.2 TaxID=2723090 RepID=UPI001608618A|nr:hypothetical protein [Mucilaginibacter sp. FT3.2]MBB6230924.1 hypothetical protein [Mucilaginibacter sp. FT3.2]